MSNPVALPVDLELYLGLDAGTIDTARATLVLQLAHDLCESVVSPVPVLAKGIELGIASRVYANATSAHQLSLGSASVAFGSQNSATGIGGLYLSRADKITLRRLAGRGSAFTADLLPSGVDAVQSVTVAASSGTFTLTFSGVTTAPLAFNASAAAVQSALEALQPIGPGNVSVTGAYLVAFTNRLGKWPTPPLSADGSGLAGGTVTVQTVVDGVSAPGASLPPWDRDYSQNRILGQFYGGGY